MSNISKAFPEERISLRSNPYDRAPDRAQCVHKEGGGLGKLDLNAICDAFRMVSRIIFRIFTSDSISDGICDTFQILDAGGKKINIKTGGLPPAL